MATRMPTAADITKVSGVRIPDVRVSPAAYGAGISEAVGELGGAAFAGILKVRDEAEQTEGQGLLNKMSEYTRLLEFGDGKDEQAGGTKGYRSMEGLEAVNRRAEYDELLDKERTRLTGKASSDRVRRMIQEGMNAHYSRGTQLFGRRAIEQQKVVTANTHTRSLAEFQQNAAAYANNKSIREQMAQGAYNATHRYNVGKLGEIAAHSMAEAEATKVHKKVVEALRGIHPKLAEDYLNASQDTSVTKTKPHMRIDGDIYRELKDKLRPLTLERLGQDTVDELISGKTQIKGYPQGLNLSKAKDLEAGRVYIRKTFSGKNETTILAEYNRRAEESVRNTRILKSEAAAKAWLHIFKDKGDLSGFANKDPEAFDLLSSDITLMAKLLNAARARNEAATFRATSDGKTFKKIAEDPELLRKTNLDGERSNLTIGEHAKLVTKQVAARAKVAAVEAGKGTIYTRADTLVTRYAPKPVRKTTASTEMRQLLAEAQTDMTVWIKEYIKENKKEPGEEELKRQALRSWLKISADPENTGTWGRAKQGEEEIAVYSFQLEQLSPQQRDVARVPYKRLSFETKTMITEGANQWLKENGYPGVKAVDISNSLMEELAGAMAVSDRARVRRLIRSLVSK